MELKCMQRGHVPTYNRRMGWYECRRCGDLLPPPKEKPVTAGREK